MIVAPSSWYHAADSFIPIKLMGYPVTRCLFAAPSATQTKVPAQSTRVPVEFPMTYALLAIHNETMFYALLCCSRFSKESKPEIDTCEWPSVSTAPIVQWEHSQD